MKKLFVLVLVITTGFILSSCTSQTLLRPSQSAERVNNTTAKEKVDGITVTAKSNQWNGNPEVTNYVTPVLVTIQNNGKVPVKVNYEQFSLIGNNGERFSALPPFQITGTVNNPTVIYNEAPITTPWFTYNNFLLAPSYAEVYPDMDIYDGDFSFDPLYYDNYYGYWSAMEWSLPTRKMIYEALPEGVLKAGGSVTGYIYFQKVDHSETSKVNFRADLIDPDNGNNFAMVDIPFNVVKKN
jgi:hypothetical protein